ncbi:16S rRNA (adenine(1518)-N(6)/adenine(1519)-N(6))-dimethyltransferase RsmA [Clostridium sp. HV4-5-A1G]|uniref:16S rRNA (adenine(1518)-N(6)/adenine(1519)-N(6))- dimethyltransferase RsmA n=1 Tax=Clostridium sp. HV4-5-A1G TaxID=2004595 RepID=UPI00123B6A6D|nr:16S rRNA (adenine(1518)-N(6)/adenine(1519)-N(6))-dimethyltransferase RsmA [Clostridium sp. HV4-5-A1G]KAA8671997.1 16S rRNA (adenine(1518)-N(6)/adenine(1519)-N(6))-dimethyltransferase RsmA [Clostridium sp. HV4-5-A1G]CAB1254287.1 dimethyladenosine 16S ribosomal RNA transferase [Clostridiaceae bacterium BL-3]
MNKLSTESIVKKYGFRFSKALGQNFLIDTSVLQDIVNSAEIDKGDVIIEIGPGVGTLTRELLKSAKMVYAIELDMNLIPILKEELKEFTNFQLIHKDVLKMDFSQIINVEDNIKIVANLPYYVTTPIIAKMLNENYNFKTFTIMIQKEVGERIAAKPSCKEYGALSILVQYYCDVELIRKVSPSSFIPKPKVDSIIIKLIKLHKPRVNVKDEKLFFKVVRCAFNMRRKTLWNAVKPLNISKECMKEAFNTAGIDPKRRGETLSLQEFGRLSDCIHEISEKL